MTVDTRKLQYALAQSQASCAVAEARLKASTRECNSLRDDARVAREHCTFLRAKATASTTSSSAIKGESDSDEEYDPSLTLRQLRGTELAQCRSELAQARAALTLAQDQLRKERQVRVDETQRHLAAAALLQDEVNRNAAQTAQACALYSARIRKLEKLAQDAAMAAKHRESVCTQAKQERDAALASADAAKKRVQDVSREVDELRASIATVRQRATEDAEAAEIQTSRAESLRTRLLSCEEELDAMKEECRQLRQGALGAGGEALAARRDAEHARLQARVAELEEVVQEDAETETLREQLKQREQDFALVVAEVGRLQEELAAATARKASLHEIENIAPDNDTQEAGISKGDNACTDGTDVPVVVTTETSKNVEGLHKESSDQLLLQKENLALTKRLSRAAAALSALRTRLALTESRAAASGAAEARLSAQLQMLQGDISLAHDLEKHRALDKQLRAMEMGHQDAIRVAKKNVKICVVSETTHDIIHHRLPLPLPCITEETTAEQRPSDDSQSLFESDENGDEEKGKEEEEEEEEEEEGAEEKKDAGSLQSKRQGSTEDGQSRTNKEKKKKADTEDGNAKKEKTYDFAAVFVDSDLSDGDVDDDHDNEPLDSDQDTNTTMAFQTPQAVGTNGNQRRIETGLSPTPATVLVPRTPPTEMAKEKATGSKELTDDQTQSWESVTSALLRYKRELDETRTLIESTVARRKTAERAAAALRQQLMVYRQRALVVARDQRQLEEKLDEAAQRCRSLAEVAAQSGERARMAEEDVRVLRCRVVHAHRERVTLENTLQSREHAIDDALETQRDHAIQTRIALQKKLCSVRGRWAADAAAAVARDKTMLRRIATLQEEVHTREMAWEEERQRQKMDELERERVRRQEEKERERVRQEEAKEQERAIEEERAEARAREDQWKKEKKARQRELLQIKSDHASHAQKLGLALQTAQEQASAATERSFMALEDASMRILLSEQRTMDLQRRLVLMDVARVATHRIQTQCQERACEAEEAAATARAEMAVLQQRRTIEIDELRRQCKEIEKRMEKAPTCDVTLAVGINHSVGDPTDHMVQQTHGIISTQTTHVDHDVSATQTTRVDHDVSATQTTQPTMHSSSAQTTEQGRRTHLAATTATASTQTTVPPMSCTRASQVEILQSNVNTQTTPKVASSIVSTNL